MRADGIAAFDHQHNGREKKSQSKQKSESDAPRSCVEPQQSVQLFVFLHCMSLSDVIEKVARITQLRFAAEHEERNRKNEIPHERSEPACAKRRSKCPQRPDYRSSPRDTISGEILRHERKIYRRLR